MELLQTDLLVTRSIYHAFRAEIVEHGYLPDEELYGDSDDEIQRWHDDVAIIDIDKGWHIDLFSESSARHKGMKRSPRIVLFLNRVYDGEIGAPPSGILGQSITDPTKYRSGSLPSKAANLVYAVHLLSVTTQQTSILNSILSNVLGQRAFLKYHHDPTLEKRIFIYQTSFADLDNSRENFIEKAYFYTVPDIFLGSEVIHNANVSGLKEIKVETTLGNNPEIDLIKVGDVPDEPEP